MPREPHLRGRGPHLPPLDAVTQYPFEPGYVVFTMPCPKRIRVEAGGRTVADSVDALILFESDHIPLYYLPLADIRMDLFEDGALRTTSPYKGEARHYSLRGGGEATADILWRYETPAPGSPDLSAYGSFYWHHVDRWLEEDEEVFVHARDPYRRVDCLPTSRRVVVEHEGARLTDSARAVLLFETGLPTRAYLPAEDVAGDRLVPSVTRTQCPYKGEAQYHHLRTEAGLLRDAVWHYPEPVREAALIRGLLAFAGEHVDAISIGGRPEPKPVTAFGQGHNYHGWKGT